ncbi:uncharacterized protein BT62DRAFT_1003288 [Guyanagaster necrorhizus]|uniref:Uncharacterized protein n=1 Tax=Guyanagaster necrorhizus TaxID=856835 RepID=A0A9P7VW18_9AGAR|nr:uncharacterized protein BT62DRAFT_1003288 [Guyanagaster necrorhizus MCA 3950]KAG7448576.1 hypothetical protein BT62DRAFT_1003288 [Guyanagaster necrorhizus MCA 3950]
MGWQLYGNRTNFVVKRQRRMLIPRCKRESMARSHSFWNTLIDSSNHNKFEATYNIADSSREKPGHGHLRCRPDTRMIQSRILMAARGASCSPCNDSNRADPSREPAEVVTNQPRPFLCRGADRRNHDIRYILRFIDFLSKSCWLASKCMLTVNAGRHLPSLYHSHCLPGGPSRLLECQDATQVLGIMPAFRLPVDIRINGGVRNESVSQYFSVKVFSIQAFAAPTEETRDNHEECG